MVEEPQFRVVLRGYDRSPVDDLVEVVRVAAASADPEVRARTAEALRAVRLPVVLRGYDRTQVDAYLEQAAATLAP